MMAYMKGNDETMKRFLSLVLTLFLAIGFASSSIADRAIMYNDTRADPSANVDDPYDLDFSNYSAPFAFKEQSTTMAIKYASTVKIRLNSTYINFSSSASVPVTIKAYYWNGSYWIYTGYIETINIDKTAHNYGPYTVTGLSTNKPFYIKLSKTQYKGYKCIGTIVVEGN